MPVISTNIAANSAVRYLNINSAEQTSSLSKLASGSRITQASDDAAGLAIATRINSDVTALTQAATNASHGVSVLQTADGGASNITDILQRMKSLASQSASGTVTDSERVYIDAEFAQLVDEVDGIATSTRYNGASLLDGTSSFSGTGVTVVVGSDATDTINVSIATLNAEGLGLTTAEASEAVLTGTSTTSLSLDAEATASFTINGTTITLGDEDSTGAQTISMEDIAAAINAADDTGVTASISDTGTLVLTSTDTGADATITLDGFEGMTAATLGMATTTASGQDTGELSVSSQTGAAAAIAAIDAAIDQVSEARANIGALESRFSFRSDSIATSIENLSAASSAISDTDVASESAKLAAAKVKTQAAVAAAAQASQMPQDLLKLMQ
ncbi:MAG: flagellin [Candidatus Devosia phytovorans]|uniref:Flagellin n=1 Tax=Candidatus Devosia phytovorans TaxID=3121372 RepID=A0AAJ5VS79_9HYPH|nr:flagellin [Devosia sp.]WEK03297.1 MAG: flagellin [Devosia sp.]